MLRSTGIYDGVYGHFGESLLERIRIEAFGEDIGQNSWLTAKEYREFIAWLDLTSEMSALDVCCGAGGPALFLAHEIGCRVVGIDQSQNGINGARARAAEDRCEKVLFEVADANQLLPFKDDNFDAVVCIDAINHLENRLAVLREFQRLLTPGGKLLFTDPLTVTGILSKDEIATRSLSGPMSFTQPGENERLLKLAGFEVRLVRDVTDNAALLSGRRHDVREKYRDDLIRLEGESAFSTMQDFLAAAHKLSSERRLSRLVFLAVKLGD